ncbi:hypothetical protein YTPLAS18_38400 [Nitrospira sp.]|nr:hypothetical protein YTPLAS18_38400 [Nitrospira sp.]
MRNNHSGRVSRGLVMVVMLGLLTACGGGGDNGAPPPPPVAPTITIAGLAPADVNLPYNTQLTANGTGPFTWTLAGGTLPQGLTLASDGVISGTPTEVTVKVLALTVTGPGGTDTKNNLTFVVRGRTHRVSVQSDTLDQAVGGASGDAQHNGHTRSFDPGINSTGRFVVFDSSASNLVPGQSSNGKSQIYLHDRQTGKTELISVGTGGLPGDDDSVVAVVSDDGNFVAFDSWASNLVDAATNGSADTNNSRDVFLRDRTNKTTIRLSQGVSKAEGICPVLPPDGENCNSFDPSISADGKVIAFGSLAKLELTDTDNESDIYVLNLRGGAPILTRVTASAGVGGGNGSPALSADGDVLAFGSNGFDGGGVNDIFLADLKTSPPTIKKVSVAPGGGEATGPSFNASINGDGTVVAFMSEATDWGSGGASQHIFVATNLSAAIPTVTRISVNGPPLFEGGDGNSDFPAISRDGRFVAFESEAANLDPANPDTNSAQDIYLVKLGESIQRLSLNFLGGGGIQQGNGDSIHPAISEDGSYIAYYSDATTLVDGDSNGVRDAFVTRRQ